MCDACSFACAGTGAVHVLACAQPLCTHKADKRLQDKATLALALALALAQPQ